MGSRKRVRKPQRGHPVNPRDLRSQMQAEVAAAGENASSTAVPRCLVKLSSENPSEREEGCVDATHFSLNPDQRALLVQHQAHRKLAAVLQDANVHVKAAAATALRNLLTQGGDHDALLDDVVSHDHVADVLVRDVVLLFAEHPRVAAEVQSAVAVASASAEVTAPGEDESQTPVAQATAVLHGVESALLEFVQLAAVVAEGSDAACQALSDRSFLATLVDVATSLGQSRSSECVAIALAGAELLKLLSEDNDRVAEYITTQLSAEHQGILNAWIAGPAVCTTSGVPQRSAVSPRCLRLSLAFCGILLNCAPNEANMRRVLPTVHQALSTLPMSEWTRVVPMLSEGCVLAEDVRLLAVEQSSDRLHALQSAAEMVTGMLSVVCESHAADVDDEVAFAANPMAHVLTQSGVFEQVGLVLKDLLQPFPDSLAVRALRESTINGEASNLQHLFLAVEVGVLGLACTLFMMLPIVSLAPFSTVWAVTLAALQNRFALLTADEDSMTIAQASESAHHMVLLQIESLAEMCWTIQRKDLSGESGIQPQNLDTFTRLAWLAETSPETKIFCVGCVGCVGVRYRQASSDAMAACSRFCCGMLQEPKFDVNVRAEAANSLMDLFDDESYDALLYVPLQLHGTLRGFLAQVLQPAVRESRRVGSKAQHDKLAEIADNLKAFLQYKERHCPGLR